MIGHSNLKALVAAQLQYVKVRKTMEFNPNTNFSWGAWRVEGLPSKGQGTAGFRRGTYGKGQHAGKCYSGLFLLQLSQSWVHLLVINGSRLRVSCAGGIWNGQSVDKKAKKMNFYINQKKRINMWQNMWQTKQFPTYVIYRDGTSRTKKCDPIQHVGQVGQDMSHNHEIHMWDSGFRILSDFLIVNK